MSSRGSAAVFLLVLLAVPALLAGQDARLERELASAYSDQP